MPVLFIRSRHAIVGTMVARQLATMVMAGDVRAAEQTTGPENHQLRNDIRHIKRSYWKSWLKHPVKMAAIEMSTIRLMLYAPGPRCERGLEGKRSNALTGG